MVKCSLKIPKLVPLKIGPAPTLLVHGKKDGEVLTKLPAKLSPAL